MKQLMSRPITERATAVFCGNDVLAIGAVLEAQSLGPDGAGRCRFCIECGLRRAEPEIYSATNDLDDPQDHFSAQGRLTSIFKQNSIRRHDVKSYGYSSPIT